MDSSVPLTHHDPRDLGIICACFNRETQNPFSDSFGFKNPILDFLKETHLLGLQRFTLFHNSLSLLQSMLKLVYFIVK